MKCIFTLGSLAIGGGTTVIFEHATRMVDEGEEVYIVTEKKVEPEEYAWHTSAHKLKWVTYEEIKNIESLIDSEKYAEARIALEKMLERPGSDSNPELSKIEATLSFFEE